MFDWDNNGRTDWQDAYVFHELISKGNDHSPRPGPCASSGKGCAWLWAILLIFLILISK